MRVRVLAEADLEAALDLFEEVAAEGRWLANEAPVGRREVAARWRDLIRTGEGTILVAEEGGPPVGLAAMVGLAVPELGMLVRAERRGQGVGDALVRACVSWAEGRGAREVVLHVFPHNAPAIALYRKHGFEDRGLLPAAYPRRNGERWDAIRMALPLRPAQRRASASSM
ncbi:MAG TPA: GNAT family N-acetyltransferase [Anaeromyxobacter sp.]|nr:GNAT family N-acetyltransferase [Anaeromyxobacter sp.]